MIRVLRSTAMRLALGYGVLFAASSLLLVGFLWWRTAAYLDRETDAVILSDTRAIGDRLRDFGLAGALQTVRDRAGTNGDANAIYLLTNPAFERLAGNLGSWPAEVSLKPGWYQLAMFHNGQQRATRLLNVGLPGGFELLVGRDVQDRVAIRGLIVNALAWGTAGALILALMGGFFARRALLSRVEQINQTAKAIVDGDLTHRLPVRRSTDEFDQLALTINLMLEQIQKLVEGVRNVSNAVAHDLRTPLAEVRSRLEQLLRSRPGSNEILGEVEGAIDQIDRLIAVSNALLRLAEIDSGVRRSGFREVDLSEVARETVELYEPAAAAKAIAFAVDIPDALRVNGDPSLLAQAFANLVDNAVKYTPAGGRISARLQRRADDSVEVLVADNGPGVPADERERVMERFYRSDASRNQQGFGLGLALVEAVAKLHHGVLSFSDNRPGLAASLILPGRAA